MNRWYGISVFTILMLAGGCAVSETSSPAAQEDLPVLGESKQAVGQSCRINDHCPRGMGCYNRTCIQIVEFGPIPEAPLAPACVSDGQCAPAGRRCGINTTAYYPGGPHSYCLAPTCSVSWNPSWVPQNSTTNFTVTSNEMPVGSYSLLYGTKNGTADEYGSYYDWVSGIFPITNYPGFAGYYMRYIDMYTPDGRWFCQTNQSYVYAY